MIFVANITFSNSNCYNYDEIKYHPIIHVQKVNVPNDGCVPALLCKIVNFFIFKVKSTLKWFLGYQ